MASGDASARGLPRARLAAGRERQKAVRARKVEAILADRANGHRTDRIAREQRIDVVEVERVLRERRAAGDKRALTDHQAVRAAHEAAIRETAARAKAKAVVPPAGLAPVLAEAAAAVAPSPARSAPEPVRRFTFAPAEADRCAAYVARLRDMGAAYAVTRPEVHAGLNHLADLFTYCPTAYPEYAIPPGTATLASTDRDFPRLKPLAERSLHTSHGALCAAG